MGAERRAVVVQRARSGGVAQPHDEDDAGNPAGPTARSWRAGTSYICHHVDSFILLLQHRLFHSSSVQQRHFSLTGCVARLKRTGEAGRERPGHAYREHGLRLCVAAQQDQVGTCKRVYDMCLKSELCHGAVVHLHSRSMTPYCGFYAV